MIRWGFPQLRVNCCSLWGRSWHFCHHSFVIQMLSNFTVANNLWVLLTGPLTSEMTAHAYYANENNMIGMYRSEQFECQYYLKPQLWIYKSSSFLLHLDELSRRNISIVNLHPWSHEDGSACISPQKNYKSHNKRQVSRSVNFCISWLKHSVPLVEENLSNATYSKKTYRWIILPSNQRYLVVICPKFVRKNLQLTRNLSIYALSHHELQWTSYNGWLQYWKSFF